jgi:hypothetical protein
MSDHQRVQDYRRTMRWPAGDVAAKTMTVGGFARESSNQQWQLVLFRVAYRGAELQAPLIAVFSSADGGSSSGPVDVPLALVVEEPITVSVRPVSQHAAEISIILSATPVCGGVDSYCTRTVIAALNEVIVLPQWVRTVSAGTPAAFQLRDRSAVALTGVVTTAAPRMAAAYDLIATTAGAITLWY